MVLIISGKPGYISVADVLADVLGHKDVNTTRKHYAEIVEENKRSARNIVKLRKD